MSDTVPFKMSGMVPVKLSGMVPVKGVNVTGRNTKGSKSPYPCYKVLPVPLIVDMAPFPSPEDSASGKAL